MPLAWMHAAIDTLRRGLGVAWCRECVCVSLPWISIRRSGAKTSRCCLQHILFRKRSLSMTALRKRTTEDMQVRNLSPHTQTSYVQQFRCLHATSTNPLRCWERSRSAPIRSTSPTKRSWPLVPFSLPSPPCAFSTRSRSRGGGHSMRSSRRPRNLRNCPSFSEGV
jgi:hypothetical protein